MLPRNDDGHIWRRLCTIWTMWTEAVISLVASSPQHRRTSVLISSTALGVVALAATTTVLTGSISIVWWWSSILRQLRVVRESILFGSKQDPFRMIRCSIPNENGTKSSTSVVGNHKIRMLDLDPSFRQKYGKEWKLLSLGDYLSSLQPYLVTSNSGTNERRQLPDWIEREMQAGLVAALVQGLGPHLGAAVLPSLAVPWIRSTIHRLAQRVAQPPPANDSTPPTAWTTTGTAAHRSTTESFSDGQKHQYYPGWDQAGLPLSLASMTYMAEFNYQRVVQTTKNDNVRAVPKHVGTSSLEKLRLGEVGYTPTFGLATVPSELTMQLEAESTSPHLEPLVPNPFVFSEHWIVAIESMEMLILQEEERAYAAKHARSTHTTGARDYKSHPSASFYDPHSKDLPPPIPIDERWLPDLYLGWGSNVQCTHTHRQILQNRLLAVLLNRLAYNYSSSFHDPDDASSPQHCAFVAQIYPTSPEISSPNDLIQSMMDMGHSVEACVRSHSTTFGIALCVREHDYGGDPWSHIPLAYFVQNGYSDEEANEAFACLPHSGLNLEIGPGPLLKQGVSIQHFMAIDGLCGWHSNHQVENVPWVHTTDCSPVWHNDQLVADSVRMAAFLAVIINVVGTKYDLPYGGYGLTGVCNDSAALIEYAMTGRTNIYPLTFNGKFAMHNLRVALELRNALLQQRQPESAALASIDRLIGAVMMIPSDTNTLPSEARDQCRRQLHSHPPEPAFSLMVQSRKVIEVVRRELDDAATSCSVFNGH